MGRTRSFDAQAAVNAARQTFWDKGYEDTSVPDLEAATGLNRSSLYHAFGSKRGLFDAAIASYLDDVVRPPLAPLMLDDVAPDALFTYLERAAARVRDASLGNGCLMLNTAAGTLAHDSAMSEGIRAYRVELEGAFARGVRAARPSLGADPAADLASELTGAVLAGMLLARVDPAAAARVITLAAERVRPR